MERPHLTLFHFFILLLMIVCRLGTSHAATHLPEVTKRHLTPIIQPQAPHLSSKAYIIIDANSGKIIAEKNAQKRLPPASLTKLMTLYVVSNAIRSGQISLKDEVRISKKAWKTGGSKMFVREGQMVSVAKLIKGVIVDSGNDACVALAEYIAGNETNFAKLMNQHAKSLGMNHSHFTDSTGLPHKDHYSTAFDLAILGRALIKDFPEYYHWYKQKWFKFNGIKQPNRNRLLWRNPYVDGLKTGHTDSAGYCLIASAKKGDMRLITAVLGASSDTTRSDGTQRLLTFGFRFYETHKLFANDTKVTTARVWKGKKNQVNLGITEPLYITIPTGQYQNLNISTLIPNNIIAPVKKGEKLGNLVISLNNKTIAKRDLIALSASQKGGLFSRIGDGIRLTFHNWFGGSSKEQQG